MYYVVKSMLRNLSITIALVMFVAGEYSFALNDKNNNLSDKDAIHISDNPPNTIQGVKKQARDGDYVLLKGTFISKVDAGIYEFHDEAKDAIFVDFGEAYALNDLFFNREFFIWGTVQRSGKNVIIKAISLSAAEKKEINLR